MKRHYFDHDFSARNDQKILRLRYKHGAGGYGVYWMVLEVMAEDTEGYIAPDSIGGLSLTIGVDVDTLSSIISDCVEIGLFKVCAHGNYYSTRMINHKKLMADFSEHGKRGAKARWGNNSVKVRRTKNKSNEWPKMIEFFGTCVKCYGKSGLEHVEKDHIILLSKGGEDHPSNWQPLCAKCNASKGLDMTDYRIAFCEKNSLSMPPLWTPHGQCNAIRVEKRKRKENKQASSNKNNIGQEPVCPERDELLDAIGIPEDGSLPF